MTLIILFSFLLLLPFDSPCFAECSDTQGEYSVNILKGNNYPPHSFYTEDVPRGIMHRPAAPGDSLNMSLIGRWYDGPCRAVAARGDTAYFCNGAYFMIVDFTNNGVPFELGRCTLPCIPQTIEVEGDYAFIADLCEGLRIIDISDPTNPVEAGTFDAGCMVFDLAVTDEYVYLADSYSGCV